MGVRDVAHALGVRGEVSLGGGEGGCIDVVEKFEYSGAR